MKYGYARVSTKTQNLERQFTNILAFDSKTKIYSEKYTGTKNLEVRPEWKNLMKVVKSGDTIIFDSVSRMSRNAEDGMKTYFELIDQGIHLVFLNERYIDSDIYESATKNEIKLVGNEIADEYIKTTNKVLRMVAKNQIRIAFEQAEKERDDISERTKQGLRETDKRLGNEKGVKLNVMKSFIAKDKIFNLSKSFNGTLSDEYCMQLSACSRNSFYKYKREVAEDIENGRPTDYDRQMKEVEKERKNKR